MSVPFKRKEKRIHENSLPIQVYLPVYRYVEKRMINLETQGEEEHLVWLFVAQVNLNSQFNNGRKYRDARGIVDKNPNKRVFGYEALSQALTDARGLPILAEDCERLVKDAIDRQIPHAKFILKSDLVPCSPDQYKEKNEWLVVANLPSSDDVYRKINVQLRELKSPLRIKSGLKTKIVEG